jgi:hypothetical protein
VVQLCGVYFESPKPVAPPLKPKREKKPKLKNDPALVAKARELRDRYLEQFNSGGAGLILPAGKYEVARQLPPPVAGEVKQIAA